MHIYLYQIRWMTDEQYNLLMPTLLQGRPNTYTLTKALAENLLEEEAQDLPVAIIRPSIIGAALNEPLPVCLCYRLSPKVAHVL